MQLLILDAQVAYNVLATVLFASVVRLSGFTRIVSAVPACPVLLRVNQIVQHVGVGDVASLGGADPASGHVSAL